MARKTPARPGPAAARRDRLLLAASLVAALALRLALALRTSGLTMDSALYVRMAEDALAGRHAATPAHHGYSLLVALASLALPGREWPARTVSLLASLALVALAWGIARRRMTPWPAFAATMMVALHPLLAVYGGAVMTEAAFLALAFSGVWLLDRGRAGPGGALLGAAWWVRPEAALVAPLAVLGSPFGRRARLVALLAAAAVALPYGALLRVEQGRWSLTPKTALVRAPFSSERAAEWRLADSTAFADTVGLLPRIARDGGAIVRAWPSRLAAQARRVLEAWPWPLLVLSLAGLATRAGRGPWLAFLALPLVYPLLSAPADLRFAQLVVPALALAAAGALPVIAARGRAGAATVALLLCSGAALLATGPAARLATHFDDGPVAAMRGAGAWLEAHTPAGAVIMDRKSYVPFFARRTHVQLPDEPLDRLLDWARASGATHLVVEEYVVRSLRPQLAPLLDERALAREPRVRLVFATRPAPGDGVAVFEVER